MAAEPKAKTCWRIVINDRVRTLVDPRHEGRVDRFFPGSIAEVIWDCGWRERIHIDELELINNA